MRALPDRRGRSIRSRARACRPLVIRLTLALTAFASLAATGAWAADAPIRTDDRAARIRALYLKGSEPPAIERFWAPEPRGIGHELIGGKPATEKQFPYVAALVAERNGGERLHCTGVLIDPTHILTAAHCLCDQRRPGRRVVIRWVYFGKDYRASSAYIRVVRQMAYTARYCPLRRTDTDIGLLRLARPADMYGIEPIGLAPGGKLKFGQPGFIVGFGIDDNRKTGVQNWGVVAVVSPRCDGTGPGGPDSRVYKCLPGRETIAKDNPVQRKGPTDTCFGDSGGPFLVQREIGDLDTVALVRRIDRMDWSKKEPPVALAAVTSRSASSASGPDCGDGGIYALIDEKVVAWLRRVGVRPTIVD